MVQKYIDSLNRVIKEIDNSYEDLSSLCNKTIRILNRIYPDKNLNIAVGDQIMMDINGNEYYGKQQLKQLIIGYINELKELGLPQSSRSNTNIINNIYSRSTSIIGKENLVHEKKSRLDEIKESIQELKEKMELFNLKADTIGELMSEISTVDEEISSVNPKSSILNESLNTIKSILVGVASNVYTPLILEKLENLIK